MSDIELVDSVELPEVDDSVQTMQMDVDKETEDQILDYLIAEMEQSMSERSEREELWMKYRRQIEAEPNPKREGSPIKNGSNVVPPLTMVNTHTMYAKLKSYFDTKNPFWYITSILDDAEARKDAALLTKYFGILATSPTDLNLAKAKRTIHFESGGMGTCFVKVAWTRNEWNFKIVEDGVARQATTIYHEGPEIIPVAQENVVYPDQWEDVQLLPWISQTVDVPMHLVHARMETGIYEQIENVEELERHESTAEEQASDDRSKINQERRGGIRLREFHFFWDIDGDGMPEDLIWTIHVPSRTIFRRSYNQIGARIFEPFVYMHRPFKISGKGVAQMSESSQDEVELTHNLRNDSMRVANVRMFAMKQSVLHTNSEGLWPGKIWITSNPREDIVPLQLGDVYNSSMASEQMSWSQAAQATGMSEVARGFSDPTLGTRDTMGGQAMRLQQSQGVFGSIAEGQSDSWSRVGLLIHLTLVRHRDQVIKNERIAGRLTGEEVDRLDRILAMKVEDVPRKLKFSVKTSDAEQSFEVRRQSMLTLTQMFTQYSKETIPLAFQLFGPQGMQMQQASPDLWKYMLEIFLASTKMLKEVFEFFRVDNTEDFIPDTSKFEAMKEMLQAMQGIQQGAMNGFPGQQQIGGAGPQVPGAPAVVDGGTAGATGPGGAGQGQGAGGFPGGF